MRFRLIDLPSPNHGTRPAGTPVDMLVLHYTGMPTAEAALERLCDPAAEVSAHYVIDEDGMVYRLVREDRRAWHAGRAVWRGVRDVNSRSIGIELVNPGHEHGYRPFPDAQMAALRTLAAELVRDYAIPPLHVVGHADIAPARKLDPGELFDWRSLADAGIGAWPEVAETGAESGVEPAVDNGTVPEIRRLLARIGYDVPDGMAWDETARLALLAFQRHWHPGTLTGEPDGGTVARLRALAAYTCIV